jgi:hypothetical protein
MGAHIELLLKREAFAKPGLIFRIAEGTQGS